MAIGTAGFTSMQAVMALEAHGLTPEAGEVLVTGSRWLAVCRFLFWPSLLQGCRQYGSPDEASWFKIWVPQISSIAVNLQRHQKTT